MVVFPSLFFPSLLHPESRLFAGGRIAGAWAVNHARGLLAAGTAGCVVAGEGAAAALVGPVHRLDEPQLLCLSLGFGDESAPLRAEAPLRADGLVQAVRAAFTDARCGYGEVDFRLTDLDGARYGIKEAALAMTCTLRGRKESFDVWHPADCLAEVDATIVPMLLGIIQAAATRSYAPGAGALCHVAGGDGERAAFVFRRQSRSGT